jgi:hypothetical protein
MDRHACKNQIIVKRLPHSHQQQGVAGRALTDIVGKIELTDLPREFQIGAAIWSSLPRMVTQPLFEHHQDPHHLAVVSRVLGKMLFDQPLNEVRSYDARASRDCAANLRQVASSAGSRVAHTPKGSPKPFSTW